ARPPPCRGADPAPGEVAIGTGGGDGGAISRHPGPGGRRYRVCVLRHRGLRPRPAATRADHRLALSRRRGACAQRHAAHLIATSKTAGVPPAVAWTSLGRRRLTPTR